MKTKDLANTPQNFFWGEWARGWGLEKKFFIPKRFPNIFDFKSEICVWKELKEYIEADSAQIKENITNEKEILRKQ